jgi:hypothetical protein
MNKISDIIIGCAPLCLKCATELEGYNIIDINKPN